VSPDTVFKLFFGSLIVSVLVVPAVAAWRPGELPGVLSVLAIIYAGASALGAWMAIRETRLDRKERTKPLLFIDFPMTPDHETFVVLTNAGGGVARDVRVEFDPSPVDHHGKRLSELSLFREPIRYLLPGEDRQHFFHVSHKLLDGNDPVLFTVRLECKDDEGTRHHWEYLVDLREWKDITGPRRTVAQQLDVLNKRLEKLSNTLASKKDV